MPIFTPSDMRLGLLGNKIQIVEENTDLYVSYNIC